MKELYLDLACGAAGDMLLAALVDAGVDFKHLMEHLHRLPLNDWDINREKTVRSGISATYIEVIDKTSGHGEETHSHGGHDEHGHDHSRTDHSHNTEHHKHSHHHNDAATTHIHAHSHAHINADSRHNDQDHEQHLEHDHSHGHDHSHSGPHRHLKDMLEIIENADIPHRAKQRASDVFTLIAQAEGKVHGKSPQEVHFHEVSGIDTMIDVTGVCLALEMLDVEHVYASAVAVGGGHVHCAHGVMPVPAPATQEILLEAGIPYVSGPVEKELLTPTGAALLAVICDDFKSRPGGRALGVGYGAGKADFPSYPNTVRAVLYDAEMSESTDAVNADTVTEFRASIDDMSGEEAGELLRSCYCAGALEAYCLPAVMKKSRPGFELVVICKPGLGEKLEHIIFRSGATLGLRKREYQRSILARKEINVEVYGQPVRVKAGFYAGEMVSLKAEHCDCHKVACETGKRFRDIRMQAASEAMKQLTQ